jgi:hypothetical protein
MPPASTVPIEVRVRSTGRALPFQILVTNNGYSCK